MIGETGDGAANQAGKDGPEHLVPAPKDGGHVQTGDCSEHHRVHPDPQWHQHVPLHGPLKLDCGTRSAGWPSLVLVKALASAQCRYKLHEPSAIL